jgi:hypothetical protein
LFKSKRTLKNKAEVPEASISTNISIPPTIPAGVSAAALTSAADKLKMARGIAEKYILLSFSILFLLF